MTTSLHPTLAFVTAIATSLCLLCLGCTDPQVIPAAALNGPITLKVARGDVCLDIRKVTSEGLLEFDTRPCAQSLTGKVKERGAIGLVPNTQIDRLSVVALNLGEPNLLDVNPKIPGITSITVGRGPVDVAVSPDGQVAYVANQIDGTLSVVDLWAMKAISETVDLGGTPKSVSVLSNGQVLTALSNPSALHIHPGYTCEKPGTLPVDFTTYVPDGDCKPNQTKDADGNDVVPKVFPLQGKIKRILADPTRSRAYVLYAGQPSVSVLALPGSSEACGNGATVLPCEVKRIPLRPSCSDGLDNDGDGLSDQDDPQCFGPLDSEAPDQEEVVGRRIASACTDGQNNDGDNKLVDGMMDGLMDTLVDAQDPGCLDASGQNERREVDPESLARLPECNNGRDDDGDGLSDDQDPECYGVWGATERAVATDSVLDLGIDELGKFLYAIESSERQALIIDLDRDRLLDAAALAQPADDFAPRLGVSLGRISTPTAIAGRVLRRLQRDPDPLYAGRHGIVRYDFGAHVSADSGIVYFVQTATVFCEVWEFGGDGLLSNEAFYTDPAALAASQESKCLELPAFETLRDQGAPDSCQRALRCQSCIEDDAKGGDFMRCQTECEGEDEAALPELVAACRLPKRLVSDGLIRQVVNPKFDIADRDVDSATQLGRATCDQPTELLGAMQDYLQSNPGAAQGLDCGSPLMPQPISPLVPTRGRTESFDALPRVDLLEERELTLGFDPESGQVESTVTLSTRDYRIRDEEVVVVYEGVLPGSRREDGLVKEGGAFEIGALDPCATDIRVGDRLTILTPPGTDTGGVPTECKAFQPPENLDEQAKLRYLTYRIVSVAPEELGLEPITKVDKDGVVINLEEGGPFATALPLPACFPRGLTYSVRPHQEWLVYGDQSGIASATRLGLEGCVPRKGSDSPRATSRVKTGQTYNGPLFDLYLYPGPPPLPEATERPIQPVQDQRFAFRLDRNFLSAADPTGLGLSVLSIRPSNIGVETLFLYDRSEVENFDESGTTPPPLPRTQALLWTLDVSDNVLYLRNVTTGGDLVTLR